MSEIWAPGIFPIPVVGASGETGWQPIETAPKDGTWVLLTGGVLDYGWDDEAMPPVVCGQFRAPGWQFAWYDSGYYGSYEQPTHWMPLPDPPQKESPSSSITTASRAS